MTDFVINQALDGVTDFTLFERFYDWSGGNIDRIGAFTDIAPGDTYTLNFTLSGIRVRIRSMEIDFRDQTTDIPDPGVVNFFDTNDGGNRRIDFLGLAAGVTNISLIGTRIQLIRGAFEDVGTSANITLGSARTTAIDLFCGCRP